MLSSKEDILELAESFYRFLLRDLAPEPDVGAERQADQAAELEAPVPNGEDKADPALIAMSREAELAEIDRFIARHGATSCARPICSLQAPSMQLPWRVSVNSGRYQSLMRTPKAVVRVTWQQLVVSFGDVNMVGSENLETSRKTNSGPTRWNCQPLLRLRDPNGP